MEEKKVKQMPKRCKCGRFLKFRAFTAGEKQIKEMKKTPELCDRCREGKEFWDNLKKDIGDNQ